MPERAEEDDDRHAAPTLIDNVTQPNHRRHVPVIKHLLQAGTQLQLHQHHCKELLCPYRLAGRFTTLTFDLENFSVPLPSAVRICVSFGSNTADTSLPYLTLHYITLATIYSGLSKNNFKDRYGDAATEQCLGTIAKINTFSVSDKMLRLMGQTGRRQVDCSRVVG